MKKNRGENPVLEKTAQNISQARGSPIPGVLGHRRAFSGCWQFPANGYGGMKNVREPLRNSGNASTSSVSSTTIVTEGT